MSNVEVKTLIFGIGNDIVEVKRVAKACESERFLCKVFTENELEASKGNFEKLAGIFAAKEAVSKAFGTGFGAVKAREIEILKLLSGKPTIRLSGAALDFASEKKFGNMHLSISHSKDFAVAVVVIDCELSALDLEQSKQGR